MDRDMLTRHMGIGIGHIHQTTRNMETALQDLDGETEEEKQIREAAEQEWEKRMNEAEGVGGMPDEEENDEEECEGEAQSDDDLSDNDVGYDNL